MSLLLKQFLIQNARKTGEKKKKKALKKHWEFSNLPIIIVRIDSYIFPEHCQK